MNVSSFSDRYRVRCLGKPDIEDIFSLCSRNRLYYQYCPPFVTVQSIMNDMKALPSGKDISDKYYLGYYREDQLIAIMDFIAAYPDDKTAFIGFFMTAVSVQNEGIGSKIINELCSYLPGLGFTGVRLGWVKGNPQAEHFWHKNGFTETGDTYDTGNYTVIIAQRFL